MFGGKYLKAGLAPHNGLMSMLQGGSIRDGMGDMLFGHDPLYGKYLKKQAGLFEPQHDMDFPGVGGEQVGYGDYTGGMGASGGQNPYAMIRGR